MTHRDLMARMTWRELAEWQALARLERQDEQKRQLAADAEAGVKKRLAQARGGPPVRG